MHNFIAELRCRFGQPGPKTAREATECHQLKRRPVVELFNLHADMGKQSGSDVAGSEIAWMQVDGNTLGQYVVNPIAAQAKHDAPVRLVCDRRKAR